MTHIHPNGSFWDPSRYYANLVRPDAPVMAEPIPWIRGMERVAAEPRHLIEHRCAPLIHSLAGHADHAVREAAATVKSEAQLESLASLAMLAAAGDKLFLTTVRHGDGSPSHEIHHDVWRGLCRPCADPLLLARTGNFLLLADCLPQGCPAVQLAKQTIYIDKQVVDAIFELDRPSSTAALIRTARDIVARVESSGVRSKFLKRHFIDEMKTQHPRNSERSILKIWNDELIVPEKWRRHGRRKD